MGCYAMQPSDYDRFKPFFSKVLADYHKVPADRKHVNDWELKGIPELPEDGVLDLGKLGLPALSMRVRVGRNLADFPLPGAMTKVRVCFCVRVCEGCSGGFIVSCGGSEYAWWRTETLCPLVVASGYFVLVHSVFSLAHASDSPVRLSTVGPLLTWLQEDRIRMESKMCEAFEKLISMPEYGGNYNSLTPGHPNHVRVCIAECAIMCAVSSLPWSHAFFIPFTFDVAVLSPYSC